MIHQRRQRPQRPAALVLDARERHSLTSVRSLGRAGIEVIPADPHSYTPAFRSRFCSRRAVLPDPHDADAYVDRVIELCEMLGSPVVMTGHDGSIAALRSRRTELDAVARVALARENPLSVAVDKHATQAVAARLGVPVPPGRTVTDMAAAAAAIDELGLPLVVKPALSWKINGTRGFGVQLSIELTRGAALSRIGSLVEKGMTVLVQRWLPGARDAISLFLADDAVLAKFAVRTSRMYPVIGGDSIIRETIPLPSDISAMAESLVRELGLEGYCEVEFRRDERGQPYLMEINPRLNAGVEVAVRAGVNVPLMLYQWAAGERLRPALQYATGRRMRWLAGDARWLAAALANPEHPDAPSRAAAIAMFIAEFLRPAGYDYVAHDDLAPALLEVVRTGMSAGDRIAALRR